MEEIREAIKNEKNLTLLGKGQFGKVYKFDYQGVTYAVKKISKEIIDYNKDDYLKNYLPTALNREIEILKKMSEYENSVKIYYFFPEENEYNLVLELCDTDLAKLLKKKGKFTSSEILEILEGLNKPFKYMHNNNITHRDIKPENILIKFIDSTKTKFIPKIGDYGISRELEEGKASTYLGSPIYMAPEIKFGERDEYDEKVDLFSLGVMIYHLYFNSFPFKITNNIFQTKKNYKGKKMKDCEDKVLDDLINKLLIYNPDDRISWDEYFNHPFFNKKIDENLINKMDNLKINDEKKHQIIKLYDYTLEKMMDICNKILFYTPRNIITIDECLKNKDEPFYILGILGKYLEQIGISVLIDKEEIQKRNPDLSDYHKTIFQLICNGYILKTKYLLNFDWDKDRIKYIINNPIERANFNGKLKMAVMESYNLKEEEIIITNHRRINNKFTAYVIIKSNFNQNITKEGLIKVFSKYEELKSLETVEKELMIPKIILNKSMLCPDEDNKKNVWAKGEKRGGEDYIPPLGWIKYGINIDHNFDDRSVDWIIYLHKKGEWATAYCGITGIKKNIEQIYESDDDIRHRNQKVGVGVYCPSDPKLIEELTEVINANGENYNVGFMLRVKPDKIRASQKNKNMWVLNGNDNELRPYGILIKKI